MKSADRKKLTANELYLNECMSILYTKIRATGIDMFDEDGAPSSKYIVNVENYAHGTTTYVVSPSSTKVCFDGTNFDPVFKMDEKNGAFAYRLKPLGMEYLCSDKNLDEMVHEKKVFRGVGECREYYRYLSCGTFFILLEYCSKDENGKTIIINDIAADLNDQKLVSYLYEAQGLAMEQEQAMFDDEEKELTEDEMKVVQEMFSSADLDCIKSIVSKSLSQKEEEEIEIYSSDDEYLDICDIEYELRDIVKNKMTDEPYKCDYPTNVEDFDYQEYIRTIKNSSGEEEERIVYSTGPIENDEQDNDSAEEEYDEDDEESTGDIYSETDTITDEEGFIEDSVYKITRDDEPIEGQLKCNVLDDVIESIMDLDQQVTTLKDYYWDIYTELKKIRAIITRRKERVTQEKQEQSKSNIDEDDVSDDTDNR